MERTEEEHRDCVPKGEAFAAAFAEVMTNSLLRSEAMPAYKVLGGSVRVL